MERLFVGPGDIVTQYAAPTTDSQLSPTGIVLASNVTQDVSPILSTIDSEHAVVKLKAGSVRRTPEECARIERPRNHDADR